MLLLCCPLREKTWVGEAAWPRWWGREALTELLFPSAARKELFCWAEVTSSERWMCMVLTGGDCRQESSSSRAGIHFRGL